MDRECHVLGLSNGSRLMLSNGLRFIFLPAEPALLAAAAAAEAAVGEDAAVL
jgi:hypothetical protein